MSFLRKDIENAMVREMFLLMKKYYILIQNYLMN